MRSELARSVLLNVTDQSGSETRLDLPKDERRPRNIYQREIVLKT